MAKVWKVPNTQGYTNSFPLPQGKPYSEVNGELFSLYRRVGKRTYERVAMTSFAPRIAAKVFANYISADPFKYSIRPLTSIELNAAQNKHARFR